MSRRTFLRSVWFVLLAVLIGTGLDFLTHQTRTEYAVPSYYFPDKILFGTLWGIILYWIVCRRIKNRLYAALAFGVLLSAILQVRYFLEGYPLSFVLIFFGIHSVAFSLPAYWLLGPIAERN